MMKKSRKPAAVLIETPADALYAASRRTATESARIDAAEITDLTVKYVNVRDTRTEKPFPDA